MLTDDALGTATRWRQRIAGGLLIGRGGVFIASYFLPWQYAYWPLRCSDRVDQARAPADGFLSIVAPLGQPVAGFLDALTLAVVIGLPLALVVLGLRLLVRLQLLRLQWKVLAILAGVLGICVAYLLTVVIAVRYIDSGPPEVRTEVGEYLAFLAALAVLAAGSVMPSKRPMMVD
jgi:hypothetical protein